MVREQRYTKFSVSIHSLSDSLMVPSRTFLRHIPFMWRRRRATCYRLLRCSSRNGTINMVTKPALLEDQFIDMKFITRLTGLSDKWFYKLIQNGAFPKPIKLGSASRWLKSDLEEWLQAKINDSRN